MSLTSEQVDQMKLISEEVRTVMGVTPKWIVRWGNLLILACTLMILAMAWFIQYPDSVQGKAFFSMAEKGNKVIVHISPGGMGEIKLGQKVIISLDRYPAQKYGMLTGYVAVISPMPQNGHYGIDVRLNSLLTTYNKEPGFNIALSGNARIIIRERRLLERIFNFFSALCLFNYDRLSTAINERVDFPAILGILLLFLYYNVVRLAGKKAPNIQYFFLKPFYQRRVCFAHSLKYRIYLIRQFLNVAYRMDLVPTGMARIIHPVAFNKNHISPAPVAGSAARNSPEAGSYTSLISPL